MKGVHVSPTRSDAARALATQFTTLAETAYNARSRFTVALSGGSSPLDAYRLLATDEFASSVNWAQVYVFWGDERCVPLDHPDNNAHAAREALLDHVPLPVGNTFRVQTHLPPEEAAQDYETTLREFFLKRVGVSVPRFDLVILGMGSDGHTASLFSGTAAMGEKERWVVANHVPQLDSWRVTLTYPAVNAAANVIFYAVGEDKADTLKRALTPPQAASDLLPVHLVRPANGQVQWIIDQAAASRL